MFQALYVLASFTVLSNFGGKTLLYLANLGSLMLLLQVLFMRYNVVIGGQLISKSERGFVTFHWELLGSEGILTQVIIFSGPFIAYYIISRFIPVFGESKQKPNRG
ncbi:MAG: hypothetical protein ACTSP0_10770 [Alphaproteobacteria bacterium]